MVNGQQALRPDKPTTELEQVSEAGASLLWEMAPPLRLTKWA